MASHVAVGGRAKERTGWLVWQSGRSERAGQNRGYLLSRWRAAVGGQVAPPAGGHLGPSHE